MCIQGAVREGPTEGVVLRRVGSGDGVGEARLSHETKAELLAVLHNVAVSGGYIGEPVGQGLDQLSHAAIVGNVDGHHDLAHRGHRLRGEGPGSPGIWRRWGLCRNGYLGTAYDRTFIQGLALGRVVHHNPVELVGFRHVRDGDLIRKLTTQREQGKCNGLAIGLHCTLRQGTGYVGESGRQCFHYLPETAPAGVDGYI